MEQEKLKWFNVGLYEKTAKESGNVFFSGKVSKADLIEKIQSIQTDEVSVRIVDNASKKERKHPDKKCIFDVYIPYNRTKAEPDQAEAADNSLPPIPLPSLDDIPF
jgi:hypothetical protein